MPNIYIPVTTAIKNLTEEEIEQAIKENEEFLEQFRIEKDEEDE